MNLYFSKTDLKNKKKVYEIFTAHLHEFTSASSHFQEREILALILGAIRSNDGDVVSKKIINGRQKYEVNLESIKAWIENKLVPNTVILEPDNTDLLRLLIFSLGMPYKVFGGGSHATVTEKTRRTKRRDFEQIFSDTFIGKIGEIAFKKFIHDKHSKIIKLDWKIGGDISEFQSDIPDSKEVVSIKSTDTLESVWAEAPKNSDFGIFVKVAMPKDFFIKILAHISSFKKLLNYIKDEIKKEVPEKDNMNELIDFLDKEAYSGSLSIKGFISGFYKTGKKTLVRKGKELDYLGEVHEDKHLLIASKLKNSSDEWNEFLSAILA